MSDVWINIYIFLVDCEVKTPVGMSHLAMLKDCVFWEPKGL